MKLSLKGRLGPLITHLKFCFFFFFWSGIALHMFITSWKTVLKPFAVVLIEPSVTVH